MSTTNRLEVLQTFCGTKGEPRRWMHAPVVRGGYVYATNGHFVCRCKTDELDTPAPDKTKLPDFAGLFEKNYGGEFAPLSLPPEPIKCDACNGTGSGVECDDCDGDGEFEHGSHTYTCKECNGNGMLAHWEPGAEDENVECYQCYGRGHKRNQFHVIDSVHYATTYLWQLSKLPGIEFAPRGADEAGCFRFGGGEFEGLLMPIRQ